LEAQQLILEVQQLILEAQQLILEAQQLILEAQQLILEAQQLILEAQQLVDLPSIPTQNNGRKTRIFVTRCFLTCIKSQTNFQNTTFFLVVIHIYLDCQCILSIFPASVHQFYANIFLFININPFLYINDQFALIFTN
jgi:hypothetical protein